MHLLKKAVISCNWAGSKLIKTTDLETVVELSCHELHGVLQECAFSAMERAEAITLTPKKKNSLRQHHKLPATYVDGHV